MIPLEEIRRARETIAGAAIHTPLLRPALPEAASLTSEEVRRAISALDKAAEKGVLHANNASRRKARLMSALAKLAPAAAAAPKPAAKASVKPAPTAKKPASKPAKAKA